MYTFKVSYESDLNYSDVEAVLDSQLKTNKEDIVKWLKEKFPELDMEKYEGGIDSWWGMGSVTLFELGLRSQIL